jgi:hypothetical protein
LSFIFGSKEFNCAQEEDEQAGTSLIFHNSEDFLTFLEKENLFSLGATNSKQQGAAQA